MKKTLIGLVLAFTSLLGTAQTSKVIQLSLEDSVKIASLIKQKDAIDAQLAMFKSHVIFTYLLDNNPMYFRDNLSQWGYFSNLPNNTYYIDTKDGGYYFEKPEWTNGFNYSSDYRFITPVNPVVTLYTHNGDGCAQNCTGYYPIVSQFTGPGGSCVSCYPVQTPVPDGWSDYTVGGVHYWNWCGKPKYKTDNQGLWVYDDRSGLWVFIQ